MLNNISKQINTDLQEEQNKQDFYDLLHEDFEFNDFIDNKILNLNENGVNNKMLKNEMPFLFMEDTVVDAELITDLQNEVDYDDDFEKKPISDSDETTDLQEPVDYNDNFSTKYASDADPDTKLDKEVDYSDNQKTPVNIDEFSNEAVDLLFEMGDILGAMSLFEDADMTVPNQVNCPDEGDPIPQADEAPVADTEDPDMPEGVVMETEDEMPEDDMLDEEFFSLFESSDEDESDDEDDEDDEDEDEEDESEDEEDSDEKDEDESDDEDDEECDEEECDEDEKKSESFSILDMFA